MYFHPSTMKTRTTAIFKVTMIELTKELPSVPFINNIVIRKIINTAGKFTIPPSHGQATSSGGKCSPNPSKNFIR